jgi:hypothetical protein
MPVIKLRGVPLGSGFSGSGTPQQQQAGAVLLLLFMFFDQRRAGREDRGKGQEEATYAGSPALGD